MELVKLPLQITDGCWAGGKRGEPTYSSQHNVNNHYSFHTCVISPCICITPGRGAIACKSTATILTSSLTEEPSPLKCHKRMENLV